jgi:hypothetical protein
MIDVPAPSCTPAVLALIELSSEGIDGAKADAERRHLDDVVVHVDCARPVEKGPYARV